MEIAVTFQSIIERDDFIISLIDLDNLKEIENVLKNTIKYLTMHTIIFLQEINGKWYIN